MNKKPFSQKLFRLIFVIGCLFVLFFFVSISQAASLIWTQSSWRGHSTSTVATYAANQNNWTHYSSATNIASSSLIATSGLISLWHFNGNANDSFGANNGTATGSPSYVAGLSGQAISLNGDNAYVSVPSSTSLNLTDNYTISAWVKKGESDRYQTILDKGNYKLGIDPSNQAYLEIISNDQTARSTGNTISTGRISAEAVYRGNFYMSGWHGVVSRYLGGTSWANTGTPVPGEPPGNGYNRSLAVYDGTMFDFAYLNGSNGNGWKYNGGTSWTPVRMTGGDVYSSVVYEGNLYIISDATVYRYAGGTAWVSTKSSFTYTPYYLIVYNGKLYAGTSYGHVYRYDGGTTWTLVASLSGSNSYYVRAMAVYNNYLYAQLGDTDCGIYRYDGSTWTSAGNAGGTACGGYGYGNSMTVFGGKLYVTVNPSGGTGGRLYRYDGGTTWTDLNLSPWSSSDSNTLSVYDGKLHTSSYTDTESFGNGKSVYSTSDIGDDYTQITANYNGSVLKIYINGQLEATSSFVGLTATNTLPLLIGNSYGSSEGGSWESTGEENFRGQIDEVKIYNRALTAAEIANNYKAEKYGENNIFLTKTSGSILQTSNADFSGTTYRTVVANNSIRLASSSGYYATGTYTSLAINVVNTDFATVSWTSTVPASTTLAIKFRTATTSDMAAAKPWADCYEYWSGDDLSNAIGVTDGHSYLQYQVILATKISTSTPQLSDITINYNHYNTSGNLVSSAFDWGSNNSYLKGLGWAESLPSGTNLLASVRTASSSAALASASWTQISRGDCSIVAGAATCASSSLPTAMKDGVNDRFVQYKIDLSGNGISTAQASQFSLTGDSGTKEIYRSVGVGGENEIASGTATHLLTIDASGNLTFSGTSMPNRVGVGDAIVYDSNNDNTITAADDIVFIYTRTSNTAYTVKDQFGANTATTTTGNDTWFVYRAYTSLANAEASTNNTSILPSYDTWSNGRDISNNIGGTNEAWNIACYGDAVDTTAVTVSDWTTGQQNYIKIYTPYLSSEVGVSQRHSGKWDNNKYRLAPTNDSNSLVISVSHTRIEGLQIKTTSYNDSYLEAIYFSNAAENTPEGLYVSNNIITEGNFSYAGRVGILTYQRPYASYSDFIYNNLIYGLTDNGIRSYTATASKIYFYNNTVVLNKGYGDGNLGSNPTGSVFKNNLFFDNSTDYCGNPIAASSTKNTYLRGGSGGGTDNIDLGTYCGGSTCASSTIFADPANNDFRLKAGSPVIGLGADLSADPDLAFTTDIQNQTRTVPWDIGADEFIPLNISNVATSSVYSGQVTITWTTDNVSSSTVKYGLTSSYGSATSSSALVTAHSARLMNLIPNTQYHFRVESTDAYGVYATSSDYTFTTGSTKNIFYSVGQNTFDHKTGAPTITIANGVATFSVAQTATNIGVGDKISYGNANATTTVFISAKQSATVWNVITRIGTQPNATTTAAVLKISHAFNSLAIALPAGAAAGAADATHLNTSNLVTGNYILNIPCYYDSGPDTTRVRIIGWTTSLSNYVKVYTPFNTATEANLSQRHSGKWDNAKYRLEVTTSGEQRAIETTDRYIKVDGLQVKVIQGDSNEVGGIGTKKQGVFGGLWVSNNIIQGVISYNTAANGIIFHDWTDTSPNYYVYAWNNIIYNFKTPDTVNGQGIYTTSGITYAYNNTVYNCKNGFSRGGGAPTYIAKNNIAYNNVINYAYSYSATSTNNLSGPSQTDAPGSNPQNAKTVSFYSTSTPNFHLLSGDVNAKDYGLDLSSDPYLAFSTDIDGQTRTGTWDIGADEFIPLNISSIATTTYSGQAVVTWTTNNTATSTVKYGLTSGYGLIVKDNNLVTSHSITLTNLTPNTTYHFQVSSTDAPGVYASSTDYTFTTGSVKNIFYSVGQNTFDHKTGTPTITIAAGVATFSTAQTATNMGVGDKISYGNAEATTTVYISAKQSNTVWNVVTRTGAQPAATTTAAVLKISHAFASLALALPNTYSAGAADATHLNTNNLVTGNYVLNIPCYYDSGPDTTQVTLVYYWITGLNNYIKIYTPNNTATEVNLSQRHSGNWNSSKYSLEVVLNSDGSALTNDVSYAKVDGLQISVTSSGGHNVGGIASEKTGMDGSLWASNNIVSGAVDTAGNKCAICRHDWTGTSVNFSLNAWNNIVYGWTNHSAFYSDVGTAYFYNNTAYNNGYGFARSGGTIIAKNNIAFNNTDNYFGSFAASSTNNLSGPNQNDAPSLNARQNAAVSFYSTSTQNFHLLASDANAKDYGADLSADPYLAFNTDIDGQTRTGTWDIGADQYAVPLISSIATSSTANSAVITWTTDVAATSSIRYGTTTAYGLASSSNSFVTAHSLNLKNLQANTAYHFQIGSTDASGNRATSSDYTFHTSAGADITPPEISNIATSSVSAFAATITWDTNEAATSSVQYGTSTVYDLASSSNELVIAPHTIILRNLKANSAYHFQIGSADAAGNRATSSDYTFHTLDASAPVVDSFIIPQYSNSLTINNIIFTAHDDTAVTGYLINELAGIPSLSNPNWRATATTTYIFAGAGNKILYAWARDNANNISGSLSASIDVDLTAPEISAIASSTAQTSATITWSTNENATSSVAYGTSTAYDFISSSNTYASSTHLITLNSLKPDTVYYFQIGSTDHAGNRASTTDLTFKTKPGADITPPQILTIASSTATTTATITWTTNEAATSSVAYGTTTVYDFASSSADLLTEHVITLRNLNPNTQYYFQIGSSDSSHNRSTSSDLIFTTKAAPDLSAPIIDLFSLPATSSSVNINGIALTVHDNIAVIGYLISESPTTPAASDPRWQGTATTTHMFGGEGTYTLYAWAKDAAGNVSNSASASVTITFPTYKIGGTLSGLFGTVVLQNNLDDDLPLTSNGLFNFSIKLHNGDSYSVTVLTDPLTETCSVTAPSGVVLGGDVSSVIIYCESNLTQPVISDIHSTTTPTTATITWQTDVPATSTINYSTDMSYNLATSSNDMLTVHSMTIKNLNVYTTYNFQISATDESYNTIHSGDLTFKTTDNIPPTIDFFALPFTANSLNVFFTSFSASDNAAVTGYFVSESSTTPALGDSSWSGTAPAHYNFTTQGSHTLYIWARDAAGNESAPATSTVVITIPTYTVGGSVSGISGTLVLQNNGGDDLSLTTGSSSFIFATAIENGAAYAVMVRTNPNGQTCSITNGSGNISGNVSNILVSCTTNPYCGDGTCNNGETCGSCSADCGACPSSGGGGGGGGSFIPVDNTPPGVPENFKAATSSGQMMTSWTNPSDSDFAGVKLYRKTGTAPSNQNDPLATLVYQGKAQIFSDTGLQANQLYYYAIYSYDAKPNYSAAKIISAHAPEVIIADTIPPAPVANLSVLSSADHLTLAWTNPSDSDFAGVKIYHKLGSPLASHDDPLASVIFQGSAASFVDANLFSGQNYYYSVYAYDSSLNYSTVATVFAATGSGVPPTSGGNSGTITSLIGLSSAIVNQVTSDEADDLMANAQFVNFTPAEKSVYDRVVALDNKNKPLTAQQRIVIAYFIHVGTPTTRILGAGERGGSVASFESAYSYLPATHADWMDVLKIGNGRWPAISSAKSILSAEESFEKVYQRQADMKNTHDNAAVTVMAYGLRPALRNQASEKIAIKAYYYFYHQNPVSASAWDIVRAIAYSGAKR